MRVRLMGVGWKGEQGAIVFNGVKFLLWGDGKVPEMHSGNSGHTARGTYSIPLRV